MKGTTFIAILLTLLMALLVLVATVVFLLQGRQQMQSLASAGATASAGQESTRVQLQANLASESASLATNQANLNTRDAEYMSLEGELIDLDQQMAAATAALATALAPAPTATPAAEALAPPSIELVSPETDAVFFGDSEAEIVFVVYHPSGIQGVEVAVQDQAIETEPVTGKPLQRFQATHQFAAADFETTQAVVISIVATSTLNMASEPMLVTVTVNVPTPVPTPAPTPTPSPTPVTTNDVPGAPVVIMASANADACFAQSGRSAAPDDNWLLNPRRL